MTHDPIVAAVVADLTARSTLGQAKYGTTLARTDLSHAEWLRHAYEEALDMACYLRRAMEPALAPADAWQPIETAPRDGTEVLLWTGVDLEIGYHTGGPLMAPQQWLARDGVRVVATHWQPLPAPPQSRARPKQPFITP